VLNLSAGELSFVLEKLVSIMGKVRVAEGSFQCSFEMTYPDFLGDPRQLPPLRWRIAGRVAFWLKREIGWIDAQPLGEFPGGRGPRGASVWSGAEDSARSLAINSRLDRELVSGEAEATHRVLHFLARDE
jgi:hypothetical protein